LPAGSRGVVVKVLRDNVGRAERLAALGVTPGARVRVLQRFPGFVFECDQTELAVEPEVARAILVDVREPHGSGRGTALAVTRRWPY
jgi:DtxR family Mn-dependent transcriptional regulator/ferrous iron transport protein A